MSTQHYHRHPYQSYNQNQNSIEHSHIHIYNQQKMSAFLIRRISQHQLKDKQIISIQPNKVIFENKQQVNKTNIAKVILTNITNTIVQYQIRQPKQPYLKVMYNKNILMGGQGVEVFVFFNLEISTVNTNIMDQFVIFVSVPEVYAVSVPILVKNDQQVREIRKKIRRQSKTKENMKVLKLQSQTRLAGEKRFGAIATTKKVKYGDIKQTVTFRSRIQKFEQQYLSIQNFLKNKLIKCEVYIGEKPFTAQKYYKITSFNQTTEIMARDIMRSKILSCHTTKKSRNGPSLRNFDNLKLTWNKARNQPKITYKNAIEKLLRQVRTFVIYHRFKKMNKILTIYRNLREQQNIEQPQTKIINNKFTLAIDQPKSQFQIIDIEQNSEDREYQIELQEKKKHDYYCRKINKMISNKKEKNLGADFAQFTLTPRLLPMMHSQKKKDHLFQIKPRIGFDNWVALEQLAPYSHELMKYQKIQGLPKWECHPLYQFSISKSSFQTEQIDERSSQTLGLIKKLNKNLQSEKQINFKPTEESFNQICQSRYKNYAHEDTQIDLICTGYQKYSQIEVKKPSKQNLRALHELKCAKLQYFPYFQAPMPSIAYNFLNTQHLPPLIYELKKEDKINFDEAEPLIEYKIKYIQNSHKKYIENPKDHQNSYRLISAKNINMQEKRQNQRGPLPTQQQQQALYERIVQNIAKTKRRKQNKTQCKIASFNAFIKKEENKIFY